MDEVAVLMTGPVKRFSSELLPADCPKFECLMWRQRYQLRSKAV